MSIAYLNRLKKFIFLSDFFTLNIATLVAHFIIFRNEHPNSFSKEFILLVNLSWIFISSINRSYKVFQPFNINQMVEKFLMTFIYQSLLVLGTIYFFKIVNISRGLVVITFVSFFFAIIIQRLFLLYFFRSAKSGGYFRKKIIIWGNKEIADSLIAIFSTNPELGYETYEFLDGLQHKDILDTASTIKLITEKPHEIFVCYKEMSIAAMDKLILFGERNSIKINVVFDSILSSEKDKLRYDKLPILHVSHQFEVNLKVKIVKRTFDILFAIVLMIIGSPVFALLYAITKLTSKGKAFYKQERIGKNEEPFYIYKFRSMYSDAEKLGPQLSKDDDPRITKWGKFMRRTRLDELPQFWNVLKGEMSIVGYRPERKYFIDEIAKKTPEYKRMLNHKPGITSLGQVHYGYAENVDEMCERLGYDLLYFRNANLDSDINIILKTLKVMVKGKGK